MFTNTPQQRDSDEPLGKKIALRELEILFSQQWYSTVFTYIKATLEHSDLWGKKKIPKARISVFEMISNTVKITNSSNSMQIKLEL